MKRSIILVTLFIAGLVIAASTKVHAQQSQQIILAGYNHKPPVSTPGSGMATVSLKDDTLMVEGDFENLSAAFSGAYIMVNLRGQAGNQLYRLKAELNKEKTGGTINANENKFALTPAEKALLKKGELFINISSFENRNGELRGDIKPMGK